MAALYEGFTLCGLVSPADSAEAGVQGIEPAKDTDHVVVTDSGRSVTVYKVSDQKPLGSWTVKQGQTLTCPAVYNIQTGEYVVATDNKVIRVWKDDDINFDKVFKATVSADIARLLAVPDSEPVVLFNQGAVRLLDSLLAAPQQPIEGVLSEEEVIRWSSSVAEGNQQVVIFTTEQKGNHFLYLQRFNPNSLQKYRLEMERIGDVPISFSATVRDKNINLQYLYSSGCVYQSVVAVRGAPVEGEQTLPRTLLLKLPVGEGDLSSAALLSLDQAHVAVVGVPHPSAGAGKDFLCIWNTNFQTLQASKEMTGNIYGQLWGYSGKLYVPHGKSLTVIPYECQRSSLAAALGKLKQAGTEGSRSAAPVLSWNSLLHGEAAQPQSVARGVETRKSKLIRKSQAAPLLTLDQVLEQIKTAPEEDVQRQVEEYLSRAAAPDLQLSVSHVASELVARCQSEASFYAQSALVQLVNTHCLCHSVCPGLLMLALEKKDYFLTQLCLQHFPDIPEAVTCACLKAFISIPDSDLEAVSVELDSVSFMESLVSEPSGEGVLQNGFSPVLLEEDSCDVQIAPSKQEKVPGWLAYKLTCPVGLKKAALLNEILQTAYSENFLLPHLKDLSAPQVILFLQYLQFLYLKCSQDISSQVPGLRAPTMTQIMDWVCLLLDAHFTVLVMLPEAKELLSYLHKFVRSQVKLFSELGKIQGSLQELHKVKPTEDVGQYSIEVIELF
ncbi:nucleolar protein 11-like [Megalops cyprinoides]|uniref:nucleolar protein 11-like n=1 Tax=Megalops cyprinoides TaxID=118141 RepID=UPI001864FB2F|nr:nucleolar protein 11-like [Megalops cyprinoides]